MKKFFGLFLIAGMLVISACGSGNKEEATTTDSTAAPVETVDTTTAPVADTTATPAQ